MNLLSEALAVLLALAVLTGGSLWLQLRSSRGEVLQLQASAATARSSSSPPLNRMC